MVSSRPPSIGRDNQLIFLCGANQSPDTPSARRTALKRFIESTSPNHKVIYAEGVFNELSRIGGHKKNILDLEHDISDIADRIIIILESYSAFCELGAFSHQKMRDKLIIINDSAFKDQESFINLGPIAAAAEANSPILWYPMQRDGIEKTDGIGTTYSEIIKSITTKKAPTSQKVDKVDSFNTSKTSLYFTHDLVYLFGPITHKELIAILETAFGKRNYDKLKNILGILKSADLIESRCAKNEFYYKSTSKSLFLKYSISTNSIISSFRTFHLKNNPERFEID